MKKSIKLATKTYAPGVVFGITEAEAKVVLTGMKAEFVKQGQTPATAEHSCIAEFAKKYPDYEPMELADVKAILASF